MPKVSIVVPTYNVEEYLEECLDSILGQTLKDIEVVCVNDGSTDSSLSILKRYAEEDPRIVIIDKENGGYGMAMNRGIDAATGEYIGIVEPDDYVALQMYGDLYAIASENDLDFVKADFYRFTHEKNGDVNMKYYHLAEEKDDYGVVFNPSENPLTLKYVMNTWSGIYKKSFLEANRIRHHETPGASFQDNGFFFLTFALATRAMIVNKPYYRNRRDNPNSSVCSSAKVYAMNQEYDYIREELIQRGLWGRFRYMYWEKKYSNYLFTLKRIADRYKYEYVQTMATEFRKAEEHGELKDDVFSPRKIQQVQILLASPELFLVHYGDIDTKSPAVEELRNKWTSGVTSKPYTLARMVAKKARQLRK